MAVKAGIKVTVLNNDNGYHSHKIGTVVTSTGRNYAEVFGHVHEESKVWDEFRNEDGNTQWMKPHHYEVVQEKTLDKEAKLSQNGVPARHRRSRLYVIMNKHDDIVYYTDDREDAREEKFALGGKANGVRIFAAALLNEIR